MISLRTENKQVAYGLFSDFSNAYNSTPHELLFTKPRYQLKIGNKTLISNKGIVQEDSGISSVLFIIFIDDLSDELKSKANVDLEDLLYYADDLLTISCIKFQ